MKKLKILGLGGSIHDYSACLLDDNNIIAIEDERLTRIRYAINSKDPCNPSVQYCLKNLNLDLNDIDLIVANDDLETNFDKKHKIKRINHHLAHIYSSYYISEFDDAAILIIDGAGSKLIPSNINEDQRETTTFAYASNNDVKVFEKIYGTLNGENPISRSETVMTNSLGELYRIIAESIGLGWLVGPGKMMGMASYGAVNKDDRFVSEIMKCVNILPKGQYQVIANGKDGLIDKLFSIRQNYKKDVTEDELFKIDAAMAYSGQIVFEKILFHLLDHLYKETNSKNLCLAGGAALNSIANGKIKKNSSFKNVHITFAPGDNGLSIGAAIYGYMSTNKSSAKIRFPLYPYLGKKYTDSEIKKALNDSGLNFNISNNIHQEIASQISKGKTVAWFQESAEFGPRALGHRSILADPRNKHMRDHINNNIKKREWFRPLAPVVIEEEVNKYFDTDTISKWMQFVAPVREMYKNILSSITHVDGTARVQTINRNDNSSFYTLLKEFEKISDFPILLNTSFNINGKPIVETPKEAIDAFLDSRIDILVLEKYVINKNR
ncbi:MAG: carbamoyl transferase [Bacteroidetes bacterium]|nr:carbamoyl transferase [Bacteroidota bacterium]